MPTTRSPSTWTASGTPTALPSASASPTSTASPTLLPSQSASPSPTSAPTLTQPPTVTPPPWCNNCNGNGSTTYSINLYNQAGELVKTITTDTPETTKINDFTITNPDFSPQAGQQAAIVVDGKTYLWSGANDNGQQVSSGIYYVKTEVVDNHGNTTVYIHAVTVLALGNQFSLKVYNSAGELVRTLVIATFNSGLAPDKLTVGQSAVAFGPNGGQFVFNVGPGNATWDGKNDLGQLVAQGDYTVQLVSQTMGGPYTINQVGVTVLST